MPNSDRNDRAKPLLRAALVLPLFDSIFAVALTLLAFSVPDSVMTSMDVAKLLSSLVVYILSGLTVLIYWFKLRRLLSLSRNLNAFQIAAGLGCLLVIVLLPKLGQLVVLHGSGSGDLLNWTPSQIVNTVFLGALILFDSFCLALSFSLLSRTDIPPASLQKIRSAFRLQVWGFLVLLALGVLELATSWFNSEYVLIIPIVLILEEWFTAVRFASLK